MIKETNRYGIIDCWRAVSEYLTEGLIITIRCLTLKNYYNTYNSKKRRENKDEKNRQKREQYKKSRREKREQDEQKCNKLFKH